jgi:flavodoxin I
MSRGAKASRGFLSLLLLGSVVLFGLLATRPAPAFVGTTPSVGKRDCRMGLKAVGVFFSTQTGNTETVAEMIGEAAGAEPTEIGEIDMEDLAGYDGLIVGCPTWNTGADEMRSGTSWDDLLEDIKGVDLSGKPVAVFGCGDSGSYGDNFCDGIEELHDTFEAAGAKMIGYVSTDGYSHTESKSERDGKFLGLPLDQDNEDDQSEERVSNWISQLKGEGMSM